MEPTAVLYTRVSRDRSARRKSVTEQDMEARAVATEHGWNIPDDAVFTDNDRSASRFARRPRIGWDAVLAYLAARRVHVLLVWEVSRGDRRLGPWVALLDLCRERGILIHVIKDGETYDPRKARDRKALASEGIAAEAESEAVSDRVRRHKRLAAVAGKPPGRLVYGYRREYDERGQYVRTHEHPEQAATVREIGRAVAGRTPLRTIAAGLNDRGVPAPEGGQWTGRQIRQVAINPAYAAQRVHRGEVIGPADWPAILDEPTWRDARAVLTDPERSGAPDSRLAYQLSGAALCWACERPVGVLRRTQYRCPHRGCLRVAASIAATDKAVSEIMTARLRQPDAAAVFAPDSDDAALAGARKEERALRTRLDEHYAEAVAGRLSAGGLAVVEARLLPQIETAARRVRELSVPPVLRDIDPAELARDWAAKPVHLRRTVITALARVVIGPAAGRGARFTVDRLAGSRWHGDPLTWGEHAAAGGAA